MKLVIAEYENKNQMLFTTEDSTTIYEIMGFIRKERTGRINKVIVTTNVPGISKKKFNAPTSNNFTPTYIKQEPNQFVTDDTRGTITSFEYIPNEEF